MSDLFGRADHFPAVSIDPGYIRMNCGGQHFTRFGDLMPDGKTAEVGFKIRYQQIDPYIFPKPYLPSENTFFPEQDGANMVTDHQFGGDARFNHECHAAISPVVVIS